MEIDGFMPNVELNLLKALAREHKKILEIGSWHGRSTRAMAEATKGVVYAVDTWDGSPEDWIGSTGKVMDCMKSALLDDGDNAFMEFINNTYDLIAMNKIIPIRMTSLNACKIFKKIGVTFDMVFIDGDHTEKAVRADIIASRELIDKGGVLCGHDYIDNGCGVVPAVKALVPDAEISATIWVKEMK